MVVNDKNEEIACKILPRDIEQKASYFGLLANSYMSSVFLEIYLQRTGSERNGLELKTRLLNFCLTFNQSVFVCIIVNDKH